SACLSSGLSHRTYRPPPQGRPAAPGWAGGPPRGAARGVAAPGPHVVYLGGERTGTHADLPPPNRLMASVRRIPALSTVASAHVRWVAVRTPWQCPGSPQARGMRSVPPFKEDGC